MAKKKKIIYSDAARQFGKNSKASTTKTIPAAWGKNSSSLGRRRECPGTSTRWTGFILPFCQIQGQKVFSSIDSKIQLSINEMTWRETTIINLTFTWQLKELAYFFSLYRRSMIEKISMYKDIWTCMFTRALVIWKEVEIYYLCCFRMKNKSALIWFHWCNSTLMGRAIPKLAQA